MQIALAVLVSLVAHHVQLLLLLLQNCAEDWLFGCFQTSVVYKFTSHRLLTINDWRVTSFIDVNGRLVVNNLANGSESARRTLHPMSIAVVHRLLLRIQLSHVRSCVVWTDVRQVVVLRWPKQVFMHLQVVRFIVDVANLGRHDRRVLAVKCTSVNNLTF